MPRITSNMADLRARHELARASREMQRAMERLATGVRITRAADDPAGLISSELLINHAEALTPAIAQAQRAGNLLATADGALAQIADLLVSIEQLVVESANAAGMNAEQIAANQLQVDAAVQAIRRLVETTAFAGRRLLDGSLEYTVSGVNGSAIGDLAVARARFEGQGYLPVRVEVTASAQRAALQFRASQVAGTAHLRLAGLNGSETFTFISGTTASAVMLAVNQVSDVTGVSGSLLNPANPASGIQFTSRQLGSRAFVSVEPLGGSFPTTDQSGTARQRALGRDAEARVNGMATTADGQMLSLFSPDLELTVRLAAGFGVGTTDFAITGGGAAFAAGPSLGSDLASIGVPSVDPAGLGRADLGFLSDIATGGAKSLVAGGTTEAAGIVAAAIGKVSFLRGRLGSFDRHVLQQNVDAMTTALENAQAGQAAIRDADFALETSALARAQLLREVAISILAQANSSRQAALQLLL